MSDGSTDLRGPLLIDNRVERRLAAILAADVAGYSRLMGADEEGALARLKSVRKSLVDPAIAAHRGRIVKTTGDGMLVEFASAVDAARCAVEVQRGMAEQNTAVPQVKRIEFRIGIHVGDIIIDENDIFGDGVNIAARLEGIAEPGGVCISDDTQRQIRGKVDITFEDMGSQNLKNIVEPMRAWRARIDATAPNSQSPKPSAEAAERLPLPDKPSIAVLPFQNMSGDPEQEYFADGMVEEITTALSRFHWLFVIARTSTFSYKGRAVDVKQVSRELGVRYVLEGSVRKAGNRVRITGQLIDATTGAHLWADRFEGFLENIFELQDQVASGVVGAIDPKLLEAEMARVKRKPPANLDAYDCFLRASDYAYHWTNESSEAALRLFYKAIELDPDYAQAHAFALHCYIWRNTARGLTDEERRETARLARVAVRLGKDDAFSLSWAGFSLAANNGELENGAALLDRALALNPNLARSWNLSGWVRVLLNQPEIAIEHLARAMRLSPLDLAFHAMETATAAAHLRADRYDQASLWAEKALRDQPNSADAAQILAISCALEGDLERAQGTMQRLLQIAPGRRISNRPLGRVPPERQALIESALRKAGMPE
jgi:TolB-like protein/class 3 adenylate cyclase/Tfp pilus assembly protein PilF